MQPSSPAATDTSSAPSAVGLRRWCARHANVALLDVELREPDEPLRLLCECGERSCTKWLAVPDEDYDDVRAHEGLYVVAFEHLGTLDVVRRADGYAVVAG